MLLPIASSFLFAQSERMVLQRDIARYSQYSLEEIETIATDTDFDPRGVSEELGRRLDEFYLSDPSRKKIQQRQDLGSGESDGRYQKEWNINLTRLFVKNLLSQPANGFLIKEAPNVFKMHWYMARAQLKLNRPFQAAYHYAQSLRYRTLRLNPEVYTNEDRLSLLKPNDEQISAANAYKKITEDLAKTETSIRSLELRISATEDNLARESYRRPGDPQPVIVRNQADLQNQLKNDETSLATLQNNAATLKNDLKAAEAKFEQIAELYNSESGALLVETAELIRNIEDRIKERQKILNKKVLYKTEFNQSLLHDYSQNREFTAFANLMEMASRLDPKNPEIPFRLGNEYKSSRHVRRAIYAYEKALDAQKMQGKVQLKEEQIASTYLALGALYHNTRRYVDSIFFYEKALAATTNEKDKWTLTYELGKLHADNSGNYERSIELMNNFNTYLQSLNPSNTEQRADWLQQKFHTNRYLGFAHRKSGNFQSMQTYLEESKRSFEQLDSMIVTQRAEIQKIYDEIQRAKKPLLNDTIMKDLNQYLRLEASYNVEKSLLGKMESIRNAIPIGDVYFDLARFHEGNNAIEDAVALYRDAEKRGISPDQARRALTRLKRTYGESIAGTY